MPDLKVEKVVPPPVAPTYTLSGLTGHELAMIHRALHEVYIFRAQGSPEQRASSICIRQAIEKATGWGPGG